MMPENEECYESSVIHPCSFFSQHAYLINIIHLNLLCEGVLMLDWEFSRLSSLFWPPELVLKYLLIGYNWCMGFTL